MPILNLWINKEKSAPPFMAGHFWQLKSFYISICDRFFYKEEDR